MILKLYIGWETKLEEKIQADKRKYKYAGMDSKILAKKCSDIKGKIKEINNLISNSKVIEDTDEYTTYEIK